MRKGREKSPDSISASYVRLQREFRSYFFRQEKDTRIDPGGFRQSRRLVWVPKWTRIGGRLHQIPPWKGRYRKEEGGEKSGKSGDHRCSSFEGGSTIKSTYVTTMGSESWGGYVISADIRGQGEREGRMFTIRLTFPLVSPLLPEASQRAPNRRFCTSSKVTPSLSFNKFRKVSHF